MCMKSRRASRRCGGSIRWRIRMMGPRHANSNERVKPRHCHAWALRNAAQSANASMKYTTKDIAQLFPDLMQIKDTTLRDKVAAVWNEALTTGCGGKGWTMDELRAIPFTLLAGDISMTF